MNKALGDLYGTHDGELIKNEEGVSFITIDLERMVDQALNRTLAAIDPELYARYYDSFMQGIREGFGGASLRLGTPDQKIFQEIRYNVATFAAFKNHAFTDQLIAAMVDDKGHLRSRGAFLAEAQKLDGAYNRRYFRVERDLAIGKSRSGMRWNKYQAQKHLFPNVVRREIIDKRTRKHHILLNGLVIPLDDPFNDRHWAPDEPNCRGRMDQTTKKVDWKGIDPNDVEDELTPWNINPGKFGRVVTDDHPYFGIGDYQAIAGKAQQAVLEHQRRELAAHYRDKLKGRTQAVKLAGDRKTSISPEDVEHIMGQPSADEWFRNELLFDLREVLAKADFVSSKAGADTGIRSHHLYRITLHGRAWYAGFKELKDTGKIVIERLGDKGT